VASWALFCLVSLSTAAQAAPQVPANGSFEVITPQGLPARWGAIGRTVTVSTDAHSGQRSLRLVRAAGTTTETGVNDDLRTPGKGLSGGIDFWYKALSADNAQLNVYAIPMSEEGVENTGSPRATFTVPSEHVGDGKWHHARLRYDFTKNPKVKWVHFAARIVGTAGELLLDDMAYVERVGPILRVRRVRLEEDPVQPGQRCQIFAQVQNVGDSAVKQVRADIALPAGLQAAPSAQKAPARAAGAKSLASEKAQQLPRVASEIVLGDLSADAKVTVAWTVEGLRDRSGELRIAATAGSQTASAMLPIRPVLTLRSFGPVTPVAKQGQPLRLECELANEGNATVVKPAVEFQLAPETSARKKAESLAPGRSVVLAVEYTPAFQAPSFPLAVRASAENVPERLAAQSQVTVGSGAELPAASGALKAIATPDYALVENEHLRLCFRRNEFGFGPGELLAKTRSGWQTVAWLPRLARAVYQDTRQNRYECPGLSPGVPKVVSHSGLQFQLVLPGSGATAGRLAATFQLAAGEKHVRAGCEITAAEPLQVLAFEGPMLYALEREEAVVPGLEWLVGQEVSSGTLDIAPAHPDRIRYVVHPNMVTIPAVGIHSRHGTVGMIWDVDQHWAVSRNRPSPIFASPDRFGNQRSHAVGLLAPTVPEYVKPNTREAAKPFALDRGQTMSLACQIYADTSAADALSAIDYWARLYPLPQPAPLPRGSYQREIEFSMQAYLKSLWVPETGEWWSSKGGGVLSSKGSPRAYVADLLLGELLSPDAAVRRQCRVRAEEVLARIGGEARLDAQRLFGRADLAMANPAHAAAIVSAMGEDGAWRFDADLQAGPPFEDMDYHELGPDNAVEVGTCAHRAFQVLRFARIAGDQDAYESVQKTLELMESFRVPRAAQVWEVPVHTPDILAAADAVDAYLEAYQFSGQKRWLQDAVRWARRGLPFVYLWNDPEKPFLLGASIPVFGASWHQWSWFGRPVQWNGLRYANALLKLAEHDRSYPWRQIAETIVRSAIHQQDANGPNVALWPDSISALDGHKAGWVFAPRQILGCVLRLMGRDEEPQTVIVGQNQRRLHLTATAKIAEAAWDAERLSFKVTYPPGEQGVVLVSNVARPSRVLLDGRPIAERAQVEQGNEPGWRYDEGYAYLSIRVAREGKCALCVEPAAFRSCKRIARFASAIDFHFRDSLHGWLPMHDIEDLSVSDGALTGRIVGPDPYLGRIMLRASGDDFPVLRLRMRVTGGVGGQLFWATQSAPGFAENRSLRFDLKADGQFHEYRLEPGKHPSWAGQTITALRLDPGNGAPSAEFAVEYLRGGRE